MTKFQMRLKSQTTVTDKACLMSHVAHLNVLRCTVLPHPVTSFEFFFKENFQPVIQFFLVAVEYGAPHCEAV